MHLIQEEEMTYLNRQGNIKLTNVTRQGWFARSKSVRLRAELQKRKKLAPTNFLTQKISTKKWPKNDLKLPKIAQK